MSENQKLTLKFITPVKSSSFKGDVTPLEPYKFKVLKPLSVDAKPFIPKSYEPPVEVWKDILYHEERFYTNPASGQQIIITSMARNIPDTILGMTFPDTDPDDSDYND